MRRRIRVFLSYAVILLACTLFLSGGTTNASTQDFYFSDFTADYYLSMDDEGISHLKVIEKLTAEFPEFNQNKGIQRSIPFTNQSGANITLPNLDESNIIVLRNGEPEPIWNISREGDHYLVETGTDDYVLGTQVYTFEYEFEKVVTDFGRFQELYWDTNGNGWPQRFDRVTARVHFDGNTNKYYTGEKWCYAGRYSENDIECTINELSDGVEFVASNIRPFENVTFDVKLKPNSFVVPEPEVDYTAVIVTVVIGIICLVILIVSIVKYQKASRKIREYKGIFTTPQYQPHPTYDLAEIAEVYLGEKRDVKVGLLLDMIVKKKVELHKKGDEGVKSDSKWSLLVKNTDLRAESRIVLELLNGGDPVQNGDTIELKSRTASQEMMTLGKSFDQGVLEDVKQDDLVDKNYTIGDAKPLRPFRSIISALFWSIMIVGFIMTMLAGFFEDSTISYGKNMIFEEEAVIVCLMMATFTLAVKIWMGSRENIIGSFTTKGMEASKYMEGLKLYIKMAEADRIKMLQSIDGVDVSPSGIVKIYEKLLPYAAVFGLEKSWMNEMKEYCNAKEISEPDYLLTGITASQLSRAMRSSATYASSGGHTIAGGGSYSSSSSGSGGGGFSGGGGGGGGGGGR